MLASCGVVSALAPALAIWPGRLGWELLLPAVFLAGAAFNGRSVGFSSAVLEIAPETERPTYASLNAVLALPVALMPLAAGFLLRACPYELLFAITAFGVLAGAVVAARTREEP